MKAFAPLIALCLAGCATTPTSEPSLARRSAEAIDPRLPIPSEPVAGPADATLSARLEQLVNEGKAGAAQFDAETGRAQSLAAAAGPAQSESWIEAQEALSGLEGARATTSRALSDIDALAADRIQRGVMTVGDRAAIEAALAELGGVMERQTTVTDRLAAQLAR